MFVMQLTSKDTSNARPKPVARSRQMDIVPACSRPITSVAIAFAEREASLYAFCAVSEEQTWSGIVAAGSPDAAALDVIDRLRADVPPLDRIRVITDLPPTSRLWKCRHDIAAALPGVFLEQSSRADRPLLATACAGLPGDTSANAAAAPQVVQESHPQLPQEPVWVASDGSVRQKFVGCGWLASTGEYGLLHYRHSSRELGTKKVLVSELRAVADAVQKLRGRQMTLMCDCKFAVAMVRRWMNGHDVLPDGYRTYRENGGTPALISARQTIYEERSRITPVWVRGHQGEPLNEGADGLARLASRFAMGNSGLDKPEYRRRAKGLAAAFSETFNEQRSA